MGLLVVLAGGLVLGGCDRGSSQPPGTSGNSTLVENCLLSTERLIDSEVGRDGIPALTDPPLVGPEAEAAGYLADTSRVIGLLGGETPLAVPHNILWRHEIVNLNDWNNRPIAVTYCPLTGSSLAFDRSGADGAEFGVSGLLLDNNLVMYDRRDEQSLWPQMNRVAMCGPATGDGLTMIPVVEMQWGRWKALHPDTNVLSRNTGHRFSYGPRSYPYGPYERLHNTSLLFEGTPIDNRRPPKERVLGLPEGRSGGLALPFRLLDDGSPARVVRVTVGGSVKTIFWSRAAQGAMAFTTDASFSVQNGRIVDDETGSVWSLDGRAIEGPRKGERLAPVKSAYVAFWFAWAVFQPQTQVWTGPSSSS
ncbi:hypothetical protein BSZ35_11760 [Salinibacter sp. 10B]|nr:hypothetical protein BSZ35_11760 [Salinibacter sp. 10B]